MTDTPHPSTWEAERAALRAEIERLRAAGRELTAAISREAALREALAHIKKNWPDSSAARHASAALRWR